MAALRKRKSKIERQRCAVAAGGSGARAAGTHSHIRGLGLGEDLAPVAVADGLVGQARARKAAGVLRAMVREGTLAGRGMLLVGRPGTGKVRRASRVNTTH